MLKTLVLSGNRRIGDEGASAISEGLKSNKSLTELKLYRCGIGSEGGTALASMLEVNAVLHNLRIAGNNIGDEGVAAFAQAISKAPALALKQLVVPAKVERDERLKAVCESKGVTLVERH